MSVQQFLKLYDTDYRVNIANTYFLNHECLNKTSLMNKPRSMNLIAFFENCDAQYKLKNGTVIKASAGDIIYFPTGSQYLINAAKGEKEYSGVLAVNFLLFDENNSQFTASEEPVIFEVSDTDKYHSLFLKMVKTGAASVPATARLKTDFYSIVSLLCEDYRDREKAQSSFEIISPGIKYLETSTSLDKSISDIAALCSVSENYFRRLFKEYSGVSPKEYILNAKIRKAQSRLYEENVSIAEIAEMCGFSDLAYFCRVFKKRTGLSPLAYRKAKSDY